MGAAITAILAGVCLLAMVICPMGKAPLRENQQPGWAAWREEFIFTLKFYNPLTVIYEGFMGWDRMDETIIRLVFGLAGAAIVMAGFAMIGAGIFLLGVA